ncbi:hypothetical protein BC628DRAFT_562137 [Trametes gibbosa]|nr:hypothetical protein BC628DRAFT_562137 [Trametes gibbosa]
MSAFTPFCRAPFRRISTPPYRCRRGRSPSEYYPLCPPSGATSLALPSALASDERRELLLRLPRLRRAEAKAPAGGRGRGPRAADQAVPLHVPHVLFPHVNESRRGRHRDVPRRHTHSVTCSAIHACAVPFPDTLPTRVHYNGLRRRSSNPHSPTNIAVVYCIFTHPRILSPLIPALHLLKHLCCLCCITNLYCKVPSPPHCTSRSNYPFNRMAFRLPRLSCICLNATTRHMIPARNDMA